MPPIIILAGIMCSTAVVIAAMAIISRHISQRRLLSHAPRDEEITRRLERIEQMVETTAIEVERLGESNRFVTKLLAEKAEANRSPSSTDG
jgi:glycerol-3-phosphate O-acyltransferase